MGHRNHDGYCSQNRSYHRCLGVSGGCTFDSAVHYHYEFQSSSRCNNRLTIQWNEPCQRYCCRFSDACVICERIPLWSPFLGCWFFLVTSNPLIRSSQLIPASAFFMAPLEQKFSELSKRVDDLTQRVAQTPADSASRLNDSIEALIANQKALQDAVLSSHRLFQEALAAQSQQRSSSCIIC